MRGYPARVPRVLVSGANGVIGRALLRHLGPDVEVRAAVRSERAAESVRALGREAEIVLVPSYRAEYWCRALEGIDAVAHTVGILRESSRSRYLDAHEGSVAGLCEAAGIRDLRVVYLSILGAERESTNPGLASKARAEDLLLEKLPQSLVLRFPMLLGAGDPASAALRARAKQSRAWLLGGGRAVDQPLDTRDAVAAIASGLRSLQPIGVLELAGPEPLPYRELLRRVAERVGGNPQISCVPGVASRAAAWLAERFLSDPPVTAAMLDVLLRDDAVDSAAAWRRLGFEPRPLDESLDYWFAREQT